MRHILSTLLFIAIASSLSAQNDNVRFMSDPTLSPDASEILFSYAGDIWKVNALGGTAYRITAMSGSETLPRVSPDGKWIAFTATQDGNPNIYIVPMSGGEIRQLTFHSSFDNVDSWSWDSKFIYFTSGRMNNFSSYKISTEGGAPQRLFSNHYWNNSHFILESPTDNSFILSESGESFRSSSRKRYKGEYNPDIKRYYPDQNSLVQLTTYNGKDLWPTIDNSGKLYFSSDENTGEYNLFTFEGNAKRSLTTFNSSMGRPQVSANGKAVVFALDYELHLYNTLDGNTKKVPVKIFSNSPQHSEKSFKTGSNVTAFDVSPDNKKIAYVSRGRLFIADIKGKFIKEAMTPAKERISEVKWMSDNLSLITIMTHEGWPNVYRIIPEENCRAIPLNTDSRTARMLSMNKDRSKLIYYSGKDQLRLVDLEEYEDKLVVEDEFWFRGSVPGFSPDGDYIYYTAFRHFEQDIHVYNLNRKTSVNVTNTYVTEGDPFWSPDGKYIYFVADRSTASYPRGASNTKLYRIPLQKYQKPFKSDELELIMKGKAEKKAEISVSDIDFDMLLHRWESPMPNGPRQSRPYVIHKDTVDYVLLTSSHEGKQGLYKITLSPFAKTKVKKFKGITGGSIVASGKDYYSLSGGKIYKLNIKSDKADVINTEYDFSKSIIDEFEQMFYQVWTTLAENYYDENMHGTDWPAIKEKYRTYLPYIRSRSDLRLITNDMLGELNSSHMGFSSNGPEERSQNNFVTAATGIVFSDKSQYEVDRIISMSPSDNMNVDIRKGDKLVSVNGKKVNDLKNRESYFIFPLMPEELFLVFSRKGKAVNIKIHPVSARSVNGLLYDEWIVNNQKRVDKISKDKIGYVYLKNMGGGSLDKFLIEMTSEEVDKDALIVDLRYNTGGNIHDDVLKFLSQRPYLNWKFREGMLSPQPHFAPAGKPIVILINEQSLSDAEMTSAGFKELGLGTIVGTESYRWIIFTSGAGLVDGSFVRLPAWGCYTLEGTDLESSGVEPDIYIKNTLIDKMAGDDPQLEKAIEVILNKLN
ncbi:MAG: S41 family peptidase [Bacteroidales bacterium]|nr:S41 family peptidase [Bacteroidales bacterium]